MSQFGGKNFTLKNTLRTTGSLELELRVESINYNAMSPNYWDVYATVIAGSVSLVNLAVLGAFNLSYVPTTSPTGSMMITSTTIPASSSSAGIYGEVRMGLSGSVPSLYVYTNQWYRFTGATF
jgi:hypothetical protein